MDLRLREAAKELGISQGRLVALVKEGRVPRNADKTFNIEACRAEFWNKTDKSQQSKIVAKELELMGLRNADLGFKQRRTEVMTLQVRKIMLDLQKREGGLMRIDEARKAWANQIAAVKNALLLIPSTLAPLVAGSSDALECMALIDQEIRAALDKLADAP